MDGIIQVPVSGLYQGVSRQPPLKRAPNQVESASNFYASVDSGGLFRRPPSKLLWQATRANYSEGPHHFFRTTDGQKWILLRRAEPGMIEVRNLVTGATASVTASVPAQNYLNVNGGARLKYLQIADTTLILNPDQTVELIEAAVPALSAVYIVVRRLSSAQQTFTVSRSSGPTVQHTVPANDLSATRETVATALRNALVTNWSGAGFTATLVSQAPHIIKLTHASASVLEEVNATNSWDSDAVTVIKGRVRATTDLPPVFEDGVSIAVDTAQGDPSTVYYVRYDRAKNAWIETSYLPNDQTTAEFTPSTMPVQLKQTGESSFSLDVCPWEKRKKGDANSAAKPFFAGKKITDLTVWKGRLVLACEDMLLFSQADDLFNYWPETARESRPADPIELPANSSDVAVIHHVIPFRNKLVATSENAQLEVPGEKPLTPEDASIDIATRYNLDPNCRPAVVGDSLYYAGVAEGRGALWEYFYDDAAASNTAFDLSKHVPDYVPGKVSKIVGNAAAGRLFVFSSRTPSRIYTHTSYWNGPERVQNAWTHLEFAESDVVMDFTVIEDKLYVLLSTHSGVMLAAELPTDAQPTERTGAVTLPLPYLDFLSVAGAVYNAGLDRTEINVPKALLGRDIVYCTYHEGEGWYRERTGTIEAIGGGLYRMNIPGDVTAGVERWIGGRYTSSLTFSPFYWRDPEGKAVAYGRWQIRWVGIECAVTGDFTATITRPDRTPPSSLSRSAKFIGSGYALPVIGHNLTFRVPFNSKGDAASLTVSSDATAPWSITGYTLTGRYTNPITNG